jgi:hypothetical protein
MLSPSVVIPAINTSTLTRKVQFTIHDILVKRNPCTLRNSGCRSSLLFVYAGTVPIETLLLLRVRVGFSEDGRRLFLSREFGESELFIFFVCLGRLYLEL